MPVSDVDGTILNEAWFKGPFTIHHYARYFFRPAGEEQVEWTFPVRYKGYTFDSPLPETRVLMHMIDELKPAFIYSLHNGAFGGAFWYLSRDLGNAVYDKLHAAAARENVPLELGEMGGDCSGSYAGPRATLLVTELPYFYDARVDSPKALDYPRKTAVLKKLDITQKHITQLGKYYEVMKPLYSKDNPFAGMLGMYVRIEGGDLESQRAFIEQDERFHVNCLESEAFSNLYMTRFYQMLNWGLMIRSAEFEASRGAGAEASRVRDEAEEILKNEAAALEKELDYTVIPIRKLVGIQLECGLSVMEHLNTEEE
jgi:hypothetical protein